MPKQWRRGETIVFRDVRAGRVRAVATGVVVEDTPEQLVTYTPIGSPLLLPADAQGRLVKTECFDRLVEVKWDAWGGPIYIWPRAAAYSIRVSWSSSGVGRRLDHWYVNLHTPLTASPFGFDLTDQILDLVLAPDGRTSSWKDEREFEQARASGDIDDSTAAGVRAVGEEVLDDFTDAHPHPYQRWAHWYPYGHWPVPRLPAHPRRLLDQACCSPFGCE